MERHAPAAGLQRPDGDHMSAADASRDRAGAMPRLSWAEANQAYLEAQFALLRFRLGLSKEPPVEEDLQRTRDAMESPSAIDALTQIFELTTFEREILLLCAGVEMDSALAAARPTITFGLALEFLEDPHWSALTPDRPLRHCRLIELEPGRGLTAAPMRIDERILHYLAGVKILDRRLQPSIHPVRYPAWAAEEHAALAGEISCALPQDFWRESFLHLCGGDGPGQQDVAVLVAEHSGCFLYALRVEDIPPASADVEQLAAMWAREAPLLRGVLFVACEETGMTPAARQLIERIEAPLVVGSRETLRFHRPSLRYDVAFPPPRGQRRLWERALAEAMASTAADPPPEPIAPALDTFLDHVSEQFRHSAETIFSIAASLAAPNAPPDPDQLWNRCRTFSRPRLEDLAQRIVPAAGWSDLALPPIQKNMLQQLSAQVRQRMKVYEKWGFSAKGRRGLGITALFAGPSGAGKTLAAEVLAGDLRLDLYRIDLSSVVSKYIGETEKNLKHLFDAAEEGGVILLFDEADALFGKRGEVKDSHDRYANIEVSYLLERMENYQGLAILTTNLRASLDKAFQRRLRFIIDFPFPDAAQRQAIWSAIFPDATPAQGLDAARLAQLNMAGGNIRNIAINAAFLAAEAGGAVKMEHVLQATQWEAAKAERPISQGEIRGWA
jgi:hypothetical protein